MKLKRLFMIVLALAVFAGLGCFAVFAEEGDRGPSESDLVMEQVLEIERQWLEDSGRPWADTRWIEVHERSGDFCGVQFDLPTFLEAAAENFDRLDEGYYRFIFVVSGGHRILGNKYKILTTDGDNSVLPYVRFTDRNDRGGDTFPEDMEEFVKITYNGDSSNKINTEVVRPEGMIPASFIIEAASYNQRMVLNTQGTTYDFEVREVIVEHYPDGEDGEAVELYRMSKDPNIQEMAIGEVFEGSDLGLIPAGQATFKLFNGADGDAPAEDEAPDEEPADAPAGGDDEAPADAPQGDDGADGSAPEDAPASSEAPAEEDDEDSFPTALVLGIVGGVIALIVIILVVVNRKK